MSDKNVAKSPEKFRSILEVFDNRFPERDYLNEITHPEWISTCLHGDTRVDVACDETKHPKGIKIKNLVGTEGIVFCVDPKTGKLKARKYHSVRKTGRKGLVRVSFELFKWNGSNKGPYKREPRSVLCTPDHMFLVRTSSKWAIAWVEAQDLSPGMRLVTAQRFIDKCRGVPRHQAIVECLLGRKVKKGEHVHHKNHNHFDNTPSNLEILTNSEHSSYHRKEQYGYDDSLDDSLYARNRSELPPLNHKIVQVEPAGVADVYNMEVEEFENFFANDLIVHNCPKTGMPDLASLKVTYIAAQKCIELKSFKLYCYQYKNEGCFYEILVNRILDDLVHACQPKWMKVEMQFTPRGGITSRVTVEHHAN